MRVRKNRTGNDGDKQCSEKNDGNNAKGNSDGNIWGEYWQWDREEWRRRQKKKWREKRDCEKIEAKTEQRARGLAIVKGRLEIAYAKGRWRH